MPKTPQFVPITATVQTGVKNILDDIARKHHRGNRSAAIEAAIQVYNKKMRRKSGFVGCDSPIQNVILEGGQV